MHLNNTDNTDNTARTDTSTNRLLLRHYAAKHPSTTRNIVSYRRRGKPTGNGGGDIRIACHTVNVNVDIVCVCATTPHNPTHQQPHSPVKHYATALPLTQSPPKTPHESVIFSALRVISTLRFSNVSSNAFRCGGACTAHL